MISISTRKGFVERSLIKDNLGKETPGTVQGDPIIF